MAIALVQSAKGTGTTTTTSPSFSSAPTSGNLIVLGFAADDYNGTPDSGWTQSTAMEIQGFHGGYIWWRISTGANPPGSYTIGSATNSAWVLAEFSGCDAAPYDTSTSSFANSSGSTWPTTTIVPSTGNRVVVVMVGGSTGADASAAYGAWTNSFTAIQSGGNATGTTKDCCGLAYRLVVGDGSTTVSTTGAYSVLSAQSRSGLLISFKEAAGGAGTTLTAAAGSYTLTGSAAALLRKQVAAAGSYTLTGSTAAFAFKFTAAAALSGDPLTGGSDVNFVITGAPVTLTAAAGSYTLTGTSVALANKTVASAGSYALTGTAAALALRHTTSSGSYALTGSAAALNTSNNVVLPAVAGAYALTGSAAALNTGGNVVFPAVAGAYALTGSAAALVTGIKVPAAAGAYTLSGTSSTQAIRHGAGVGSYAVNGADAALKLAHGAGVGSYSLTGSTIGFALRHTAAVGSYAVTGGMAGIVVPGAMTAAAGSYILTGASAAINVSSVADVTGVIPKRIWYAQAAARPPITPSLPRS
jgi:hypothetical protein